MPDTFQIYWTLERFAYLPEGTLGRFQIPNGPEIFTLERPWLHNKPFVSCIPPGTYPLEWDTTGRVKDVPRLRGVQNRTQINIHAANWVRQLQGCIALGMEWEVDGHQQPSLLSSREAMDLMAEHYVIPEGNGDDLKDLNGAPIALIVTTIW